jgi:3-oxoacyl-[acyl-carrier-protein] synthase III
VFALAAMESLLARLGGRHGLVIGAETMSRIVDWQDRGTAILFGDGAGAVVVSRLDQGQDLTACGQPRGVLASVLGTDGQHFDLLHVTSGPSRGQSSGVICMQGREVFRRATLTLREATLAVLKKAGAELADLDWIVPHQANKRILDSVAQGLDLPLDKVIFTGDQHANTSAASIPLALDWGKRTGRLKAGQLIVMQAFGAGFSWGASLVRL